MEEDTYSWLRRTKFSHTVCHRWDSSRLSTVPLRIESQGHSGLKSRPRSASLNRDSVPDAPKIHQSLNTKKPRSASPSPQTALSETFREARSERKRFSTPGPRRKSQDKRIMGKLLNKDSREVKASNSKSPSQSPPMPLTNMKMNDDGKSRKESAWTKYFDHGGGRVTAVETAEEWTVDLSKLFLGLRFAHGAHSRLYRGNYKDEPVAVKLIRVPDDDESGTMASRLEKQFIREVTFLSRLHHQNVLKVIKFFLFPTFLPVKNTHYDRICYVFVH